LKSRPFDKVERCFDNVASTLLLVWTGLKKFSVFDEERLSIVIESPAATAATGGGGRWVRRCVWPDVRDRGRTSGTAVHSVCRRAAVIIRQRAVWLFTVPAPAQDVM